MKSDINKTKLKAIKETIKENKESINELQTEYYAALRELDDERAELENQITTMILDWARKPANTKNIVKNLTTRMDMSKTDELTYYQIPISRILSAKFGRGNREVLEKVEQFLIANKFITRSLYITEKGKTCRTMTTCDNCVHRYECIFQ